MAINKNLIPLNKRTKIEQRAICSMGGIASGKSRREKKTFKEIAHATFELASQIKERNISNKICDLIASGYSDNSQEVQKLKDQIAILGEGGIETLTLLELILDPNIEDSTRGSMLIKSIEHMYGKPQASYEGTGSWSSEIGKSAAFTSESVMLGIKHGLATLNIEQLDHVNNLVDAERQRRLEPVNVN